MSCLQLTEADLWKTNLVKSELVNVKLHKAKLKDADLELANLQGAELDGAELEGANFKDVKNLTWDQLKKANFEKGKPIHLGKNEKDEDLNKFWEEEVTARKSSNQALPPMAS